MKVTHRVVDDKERGRMDWLRGYFSGATVYVVGSGPSLKGFDFSLLYGKRTIGVNHCYMDFKPEILVALDEIFFRQVFQRGHNVFDLAGKILAGPASAQIPEKNLYRFWTNSNKVTLETWRFYSPALSGLCAINAALSGGAAKVILLGFDCTEGHYYTERWRHPEDGKKDKYLSLRRKFAAFEGWQHMIFNACPQSTITVFPKITTKEAFNG